MQDGGDCGKTKNVGGATVYSHFEPHINVKYGHDAGCTMTFHAENEGWTLMLRVVELDLPNKSETGLCNDALYVYDADSYYTRAVVSVYRAIH